MMKKKLLIFHPVIAPYRIDLFNAFSKHYEAEVCLFWRNLKDQTFDYGKIERQLCFAPRYWVREETGMLKWGLGIWRMLSRQRPDIVMASEFGIATILILMHRLLTRARYKVVTINDDSYDMIAHDNQFTKRHAKAVRMMMPWMDEVINVEPRVADYNKVQYGKGIYFPIICDDAVARERQQRVLPISQGYVEKYRLEGKRVLLFVGRLVALKNLEFAIRAFLGADLPDTCFVIVGDGEERSRLEDVAKGRENVIFTGRLEGDELYAWYNVGQVFVLPSYQEPFGAVTNEALVAGCKALVSQNAGSCCLVEDGKNGYAIDPHDEEALRERLARVFADIAPLRLPLSVKEDGMLSTFREHTDRLFRRLDNI